MTADLNNPVFAQATNGQNGKLIVVVATASPGTLLHTATTDPGVWDVVTITASNRDTIVRTLIIEWGGVTTGDQFAIQLPIQGITTVIDQLRIRGGLNIRAYGSVASVINLHVQVEQYKAGA
jgi:hypothetical protein